MVTNETHGRHQHRGENEVPRHVQRADRVGEDEGGKDVERRLFGHAQQCREDDFPRLFLDDFEDRGLLDLVAVQELLEHRRLQDAEANPQADADQDDRKRERNAPAPDHELVARPGAEGEDRQVRQEAVRRERRIAAMTRPVRAGRGCATIPSPAAPSRPIRRRRRCLAAPAGRSGSPRPRCRSTRRSARTRSGRSRCPCTAAWRSASPCGRCDRRNGRRSRRRSGGRRSR